MYFAYKYQKICYSNCFCAFLTIYLIFLIATSTKLAIAFLTKMLYHINIPQLTNNLFSFPSVQCFKLSRTLPTEIYNLGHFLSVFLFYRVSSSRKLKYLSPDIIRWSYKITFMFLKAAAALFVTILSSALGLTLPLG